MSEKQSHAPVEPKTLGIIAYWKNHVYLLLEPIVILIVIVVAIVSWNVSEWYYSGVIETTKAELSLSKARLDASVADANQVIEQIKELGLVLAAPILDEMATDKLVFSSSYESSLEDDVAYMQEILSSLEKLGASQEQIEAIRMNMDLSVKRNLRRRVIVALQSANKDKALLFEHVSHMYKWNNDQFESFIRENKLNVPSEVNENLTKLEYYTANKSFPMADIEIKKY